MARHSKYGHMECEGCAAEGKRSKILVRKTEKGGYSAACDECDHTYYAPGGTAIHARWSKKIAPLEQPTPAPTPTPSPAPSPTPTPAPASKYGKYTV